MGAAKFREETSKKAAHQVHCRPRYCSAPFIWQEDSPQKNATSQNLDKTKRDCNNILFGIKLYSA